MREVNIHVKYIYTQYDFADASPCADNVEMHIATLRRLRGLTQTDIADMTGLTQPTISRAEKGEDGITLGTLRLIATALGVSLADLVADDRTKVETELLSAFRRLSADRQRGWLDLARSVISDPPPPS
jgi:transcriptional regulator with XRE-family HTH domain